MTEFYKYQAAGNDFVITKASGITPEKAADICDRHFGAGADGVLVHFEADNCDAGMKIFNSDGSVAKMCGNGLRCFTSYLVNDCGFKKNPLLIETDSGKIEVKWEKFKESAISVEANLGSPVLINETKLSYGEKPIHAFSISMGNPHLVLFPENTMKPEEIRAAAGYFQNSNPLNCEVNVEIITNIRRDTKSIFAIVKERGAGFTLACGTGGGAVVFSLFLKKELRIEEMWKVYFPGGEIFYRINEKKEVLMKGTPVKIFKGTFSEGVF